MTDIREWCQAVIARVYAGKGQPMAERKCGRLRPCRIHDVKVMVQ